MGRFFKRVRSASLVLLDPEFHTKLYLILNNKSIKQESWKKESNIYVYVRPNLHRFY